MLKVQFGCGGNKLEDFVNHDSEVDISKRLPYDDNTVDFILMEHVWEHIAPADALRCLDECRRVLNPGGVLRLCVPILDRLPADHARDIILGHGHAGAYTAVLVCRMIELAGFSTFSQTVRKSIDSHWKVIGTEKDDLETLRVEAKK